MRPFSIKDLESLSGVKAHTIRMWEQRYGILSPERTDTNIRTYNGRDLKCLLNISLLNDLGYKISHIAKMNEEEIKKIIADQVSESGEKHLLNVLKIAMLNYDEELWKNTTDSYLKEHSLEHTFKSLLLPFLHQIGLFWLSDSICPAQEHFVSSLIRQKFYAHIDSLPIKFDSTDTPYILFLPDGELHDIGLLMLHYLLRASGKRSVFLGSSVPLDDLEMISSKFEKVHFVSLITTNPSLADAPKYVEKINLKFAGKNCTFHLSGYSVQQLPKSNIGIVQIYSNPDEMVQIIGV